MTLNIPNSAEAEAKPRKQAEAAGTDLAALVLEASEEKLSALDDAAGPNGHQNLPAEEWIARLRRWAASHQPLPSEADDSRASIYSGRGE